MTEWGLLVNFMNTNELLYWLDGYLTDKKEGLGGEHVKIIRDNIGKILNPSIQKSLIRTKIFNAPPEIC